MLPALSTTCKYNTVEHFCVPGTMPRAEVLALISSPSQPCGVDTVTASFTEEEAKAQRVSATSSVTQLGGGAPRVQL